MEFAEMRKKHIKWAIEQNPIEIIIKRTEKVRVGGGFDEKESSHGPFTVRIFSKRTSIPQEVSTLAGTKEVNLTWAMIADANADIRAGSRIKDEFEVENLGKFEVISVRPQIVRDVVIGYQVDLERVS